MVRFDDFFRSLPPREQDAFAFAAGYGATYIRAHLVAPAYRRKRPSIDGFERIVRACMSVLRQYGPAVVPGRDDLYAYFYAPRAPRVKPKRERRKRNAITQSAA